MLLLCGGHDGGAAAEPDSQDDGGARLAGMGETDLGQASQILQFILAHPKSSNMEKFLAVKNRMENFQYEDLVADKLKIIWDDYRPPPGPVEEREDFLEIAATMSSLFKCRSIIYCEEANDPKNMDLYP